LNQATGALLTTCDFLSSAFIS